jgi:hypothetical protein
MDSFNNNLNNSSFQSPNNHLFRTHYPNSLPLSELNYAENQMLPLAIYGHDSPLTSFTTLNRVQYEHSQAVSDKLNSDDSDIEVEDVENKRTRGATKLEFVADSKKRANIKSKRKKGLLKKINEFDIITGSSSMDISIGSAKDRTEAIF